jgi:glyoxalase family protein
MKLDGIHHITAITGDAAANVDFYTRVLGLRLAKKTVNQDDPSVYHLFYADEDAQPGADLTFFEYPGAAEGQAGIGMVHRIAYRVGSEEALDFWRARLADEGVASERDGGRLRFADPEGLGFELLAVDVPDAPLVADHPEVPAELALQGFHGVRAYSTSPQRSQELLEQALAFEPSDDDWTGESGWEARGTSRGGLYSLDPAPHDRPIPGAGTVHHVAWNSAAADHEGWRERVIAAGGRPTPVIDRFWFRSIYFREPSGVLFELATPDPGFTVDESLETLGEKLVLPPAFESRREEIEAVLKPLPYHRSAAPRS